MQRSSSGLPNGAISAPVYHFANAACFAFPVYNVASALLGFILYIGLTRDMRARVGFAAFSRFMGIFAGDQFPSSDPWLVLAIVRRKPEHGPGTGFRNSNCDCLAAETSR